MDYEIQSQTHIFQRLCEELQKCDSITCAETPVCRSLSLGCLTSKAVESGPGNLCLLETLEFTEDISAYLQIDTQAKITNWVKCGVEYRVGLFV